MARLKKHEKLFIVRSLAQFNTPTETCDLIKVELGVIVTPQQCEAYDPTKRTGQNLSAEMKKEFEETRADFLDKPKNIPIANLAVRLQRLEKMYNKTKNPKMQAELLRQAAEDEGGKFTNRKELTGAGGQPLQVAPLQPVIATPEMIRDALKDLENDY